MPIARQLSLTSDADQKELALAVSTDPDHRFDLAISLNDLETALALVRAAPEAGSQSKWKLVGDKALAAWQMDLAQEAFENAGDLPALLLLYSSLSDRAGMERLAKLAVSKGSNNIAFAAYLQLGDSQACIDLLSSTGRLPEAALFARSYHPAGAAPVVKAWKSELETAGKGKLAATIADPAEDADHFPEMGATGSSTNGHGDSEGSGVMVEKEDVDMASPTQSTSAPAAADEDGPVSKVVEAVKEPVEEVVDKVKELVVGDGKSAPQMRACVRVKADSGGSRRAKGGQSRASLAIRRRQEEGGQEKVGRLASGLIP